jgi:hypothetical protein
MPLGQPGKPAVIVLGGSVNQYTSVRFPVFSNFEVRVIFAKNVMRTGRRLGCDLHGAEAGYIADPTYLLGRIVFDMHPTEDAVAHESSHAISNMFSVVGVKPDDEMFAYHLGYLVGHIHKYLRIHKVRKVHKNS